MGGQGSGRPMGTKTPNLKPISSIVNNGLILPNHSGDHSKGIVNTTPVNDTDLVNKKYVDDTAGGGGDVTAAVNLTDVTLIQGDGGAKGIKTTTVTATNVTDNTTARHAAITLDASATTGGMSLAAQAISNRAATNAQTGYMTAALVGNIETNNSKNTNVSTNLSMGTVDGTQYNINSSDGTNVALPLANTNNWGIISDEMFDQLATAVTHYGDNTQAHSDYLLNSGTDTAVGPLKTTADNSSADTEYIPNVLYNTDATPPTANTVPIGTIYIQYTA